MSEATTVVWGSAALCCVIAAVVWLLLANWHVNTSGRRVRVRVLLLLPRLAVATFGWVTLLRLTTELVETQPPWSVEVIGLVAGIVTEIVFWCYAAEQSTGSGWSARWILHGLQPVLRLVVVGLLALQLLQPTKSHEEQSREQRTIAVVVDSSASMDLPARLIAEDERTRRQIAGQVLYGDAHDGLLEQLQRGYDVLLYQMDAVARRIPADQPWEGAETPGRPDQRQSTNLAAALRRINGDVSSAELSGVVLLTDGCDHSDVDVRAAAGFLESNDVPCNTILIGSTKPVRDAEVVTLQSPSQIYHGDEVSLQAVLRIDQFAGQVATVRLWEEERLLEERQLPVTSERHRATVPFRHQPEEARMHNYRVELTGLSEDGTPENNTASSQVWVTKDRIRVLLIEDRPRWEFRYLRNLFAGRDKSVFLQAVLLQPDTLAGVPQPPVVHASALRAFDDCRANALPENEAEWLKFDVIVLGDVRPEHLGPDGVQILESFVRDHGGSLVVIAGANHMPHAYGQTALRDLLPAHISQLPAEADNGNAVRLRLTAEGEKHVVMQRLGIEKATGESFPEMSWRHPAGAAKAGATVLAWADGPPDDAREQAERSRALLLWHRTGAGKVLQMNFDESWRLRYGIGDRLHHQFWGQMIRWCASDRLTVGTDLVRMGTDKVMYRPGEAVRVRARVLDARRNPVQEPDVQARLIRNDQVVQTVELTTDPGRSGLLTGEFADPPAGGVYRVELAGESVRQSLLRDSADGPSVGLDIAVSTAAADHEALDVVSDDTIPRQLAGWTDGIVTSSDDAEKVLQSLGPRSTFERRRWTTPVWNSWPLIFMFLSCLSVEWILRKTTGRA